MNFISNFCPVTSFVVKSTFYSSRFIEINPSLSQQIAFQLTKGITAIALPLLLILDSCLLVSRKLHFHRFSWHHGDFHFLFNSSIFETYFFELKQFLHTQQNSINAIKTQLISHSNAFSNNTLKLIQLIENTPNLRTETDKRSFHQKLLIQLRDLVEEKNNLILRSQLDEHCIQFIDQLCEWLYTGVNLLPEMVALMEKELPDLLLRQFLSIKTEDIPQAIDQFHQWLNVRAQYTGVDETVAIGEYPRLYDPHYLGDIPSVLYHCQIANHETTKKMKIIRTPAVTQDIERNSRGILTKAKVVNEFLGFLDSYQKQQKKHIYFNLMQRSGSEGVRSEVIECLERKYPGTISVITLDKNSLFYFQKNEFETLNNSVLFKQHFMQQMFEGKNFFWSSDLGATWKNECQQILENIHTRYFSDQIELNREERLDFIELVYIEIVEVIIQKLQADSANEACKSCIDRGAAALAQQYLRKICVQTSEMKESQRKKILAITLAPAIFAMNRVMQHDRISRLKNLSHRILLNISREQVR